MIDLYTWTTPNGRKLSIALEELGLPYEAHAINISEGEQHHEDFVAISPNNKIPAIVDRDNGMAMMESGAILLYLAEKTGRLMPTDSAGKWEAKQWLMWQMAHLGPMLGQAHHFLRNNKGKAPYAEERYHKEANRLYGVLDKRLEGRDFIVGGDYSIVDIACWPWISRFEWHQVDISQYANVKRWYVAIAARPAVQKGYNVPKYTQDLPLPA